MKLDLNGAPGGSTFQWQKDGVDIGGANNSSYTPTTTGSYTVNVTSGGNTKLYGPVAVTASSPIVPSFTSSPNNQCGTVPVSFTNTTAGSGLTYSWNFGDVNSGTNNTSTQTNPSHAFVGNPGNGTQNFTVLLTADNAGCTHTVTSTVTTAQTPGTELGGTGALVYNGLKYFTTCASTTSVFSFTNQSTTKSSNTNYLIKWGDGTADFSSSSFTASQHTYGIGNYHLEFIVTGQNGCSDTGDYYVFVGNNPAVGFGNPGNTFICTGTSLTFPITGTINNPPGTTYSVRFNDGSSQINYTHPAPADVSHVFLKGSCGTTSGNSPVFPNSFQATVQASNPCGTSAASVVPIYVSEKSKAVIGITPDTVICTSTSLTVTNLSGNGYGIAGSGSNATCVTGKGIWSISPATGWTLSSGTLGDDFGFADPSLWANGSTSLNIKFTTPGTYTIKLKAAASQLCGGDEVTRTICVNPTPTAAFTLNTNTGCAPLNVTITNTSNTPLCKTNTYQWAVSYNNTSGCTPNTAGFTYINGTSATSETPEFSFTNPGVYTIALVTKNSNGLCASTAFTQTVIVKTKPQGSVTAPTAVCQNGSVNPSATIANCYATTAATYSWSFPGGTPSASTLPIPGAITYTTSGSYVITLEVTNECGTTTITKNITVNAAPNVTIPGDKTFCAGEQTGGLTFTGSVGSAVFNWANSNPAIGLPASGAGNIANFIAANPGSSPITATITVTPTSSCSGASQSFTITVNPRPVKPAVIRPVMYCLNENASPLSATASSGNTVNWYTVYQGTASSTPPTPSTSVAGSTTYFVTQSNGLNCESDTARIAVTVYQTITNNTITADQTICNGSSAQALVSQGTVSGGNGIYTYQWQSSTNGGTTWTDIAGATSANYNPGVVSTDTKYRRLVNSSTCSSNSNVVTVLVQGSLTNAGISADQTICQGTQPALLQGQTPAGGNGTFTYQWESSVNNTTWTTISGATGADYAPPMLTTAMYYRRKVSSGLCAVYSSAVTISVNRKPVVSAITDQSFCNNATTTAISFSSAPSATSYAWVNNNAAIGLAATGNGSIPSFTATNNSSSKIPVTATIKLAGTNTTNGISCVGDTVSFDIIVLPTIEIAAIPDEEKCTGQLVPAFTPVPDAGYFAGTSVKYNWTVSGPGISLINGSGAQIPAYTTSNPGTTDLVATITVTPRYSYNGNTCDGTPRSYTVTIKPATANATVGPHQVLCASTMAIIHANFVNGTTGVWSQIGNTGATVTIPTSTVTTVTGLVPGTVYKFVWTQSGFASCPPTTDTVVIDTKLPLINKIDTVIQTICAGVAITIAGQPATGGGSIYKYQWQTSNDGINFTDIAGETNQNITLKPLTTTWLRRYVGATPCFSYSDVVEINVQPAIANNIISADETICTGVAAQTITGSLPTGGNNNFTYVWEQSINGGPWTVITGETAVNYSPGTPLQTTRYRRIVSTDLCNGAFGSISNVVTITVNPDAKASFPPTTIINCPPFVITPATINLKTNAANSQYLWYANGTLIGNGTVFPGYTIINDNDSVLIKLKVISAFGCKNDSVEQQFKTVKRPTPLFDASDTVGCGPLTVQLTNTS
ncbi:MAG: hypothetical protein EOP51_15800, partial [Sphingobacteriales bacterium]